MHYVIRVSPFHSPHHKVNVLIPVTGGNSVDHPEHWFRPNALDTQVFCLDNDKDILNLAKDNQLIMMLDKLSTSGEEVLRNTIPNGNRIRRAEGRAQTSEPRWAPLPSATTNTQHHPSPHVLPHI